MDQIPGAPSHTRTPQVVEAFQLSEAERDPPLWEDIEADYNHFDPDPFDDPFAFGEESPIEPQAEAFALPPGSSTDPPPTAWQPSPPRCDNQADRSDCTSSGSDLPRFAVAGWRPPPTPRALAQTPDATASRCETMVLTCTRLTPLVSTGECTGVGDVKAWQPPSHANSPTRALARAVPSPPNYLGGESSS